MGGLLLALRSTGTSLVAAADIRTGLPGSIEEAAGGDAGAAVLVGDGEEVVAELLGTGSTTEEFVERWRVPGDVRTRVWDDKFAEVTSLPLGTAAWDAALDDAGVTAAEVGLVAIAAPTPRLASALGGRLGGVKVVDGLSASIGTAGAAQPALQLVALLEQAEPNQVIVLVSLADGADALVFRTGPTFSGGRRRTIAEQLAGGSPVAYGKFLSWRQMLEVEPPRRPEPPRVSASASARSTDWKFGFVGTREADGGAVHLPPQRVSSDGSTTDAMEPVAMADVEGTIVTFTVDRLAYSPSPPIVFAIVDFDGGGRFPVELCDLRPEEVAVGAWVEMTFRRLGSTDGLPNYFWKARLVRG